MGAISLFDLSADVNDIASWLKDGSGNSIGSTGGAIHVSDAGGSLTVDASDLDIRDLVAASDAVSAWLKDGSGNSISSTTGSLHVLLQNASIVVTASDLDIRDLTHSSDSVKVGDGTDFLAINTDGSINVAVAALDTVANDDLTVGTTEVELVAAAPVANRRYLLIQNNAANPIYVGATGVTTTTGVIIPKNGNLAVEASAGVYAIAGQAGNNVRILEIGLG
jgi:hypothetical protein